MGKDKSYWENRGVRRYVLNPDDVEELERESGVHEFINKKPREEAEDAAYGDYTKKHHMQAAAHHLTHMKAAQANGNYGDAKRHKVLYDMHLKEMGVEAKDGKVPDEVTQHMQNPDAPRPMKFKAHKADTFFLNDREEKSSEETKPELSKAEIAEKVKGMLTRVLEKSVALAPQTPAPGVAKPKEHVAQTYAPTIPGKRKATATQRRRGLLVPWQIDGTGVSKPSSLQHSEMSKTLGDSAWAELTKSLVKARAIGTQQADPKIQKRPEQDVEDTVDYAKDPEDRMQVPPGFKAKKHKHADKLANKEQDPDDHGNPKEIAQDRAEDKREEAAYRKEQTKRYGSDEPAYKAEKPYMGRDEGIRRSKLPPGAPGSSKDGVGIHVDKKKAADKKAARGKVKEE